MAKDNCKSSNHYKKDFSVHPSIPKILENTPQCESNQEFTFKPVGEKYVHKIISNFNVKKATCADKVSVKILKSCSSSISSTIQQTEKIASNLSEPVYFFCFKDISCYL